MVKVRQRKPAYTILFVYSKPSAFFFARGKQNLTAVYWKSNQSRWKKKRLWKCGGGNWGWDSSLLKKQHVATERLLQEPGNKQDDLI